MDKVTNSTLERAMIVIAVVLVGIVLHQAKSFFAPVLAALVFAIILSPLSNFWDRKGLSQALASFFTVTIALLAVSTLAVLLEPYVTEVVDNGPLIWRELRTALESTRSVLKGLDDLAQDVTQAVSPGAEATASTDTGASESAMPAPSLMDALLYAPQFAAQVMIFIGTLYFFLMTRRETYTFVANSIGGLANKDFDTAERRVSKYFLTITAINGSFGLIVTFVMAAYGMPSPMFWGALAFLLNFILYLGPIALALALLTTGLVTFDGVYSVLPAATYLALNATEGQFVTPSLVGKSMEINPLLVFLALVFWLWMWGPIGGIIAIPLLIWITSILGPDDHIA